MESSNSSFEATAKTQQALNRAVREAVDYVHADGWDAAPQLFALVPTAALTDVIDAELLDQSPLTLVAQDELPEGIEGASPELGDFLARTSWPAGVIGAVLVQEIVIIAPEFAEDFAGASVAEVRAHAGGEQVRQARLITGVIDEGPELTLIQPRPSEAELDERGPFAEDDIELRDGSGVADGVIAALRNTFYSESSPNL